MQFKFVVFPLTKSTHFLTTSVKAYRDREIKFRQYFEICSHEHTVFHTHVTWNEEVSRRCWEINRLVRWYRNREIDFHRYFEIYSREHIFVHIHATWNEEVSGRCWCNQLIKWKWWYNMRTNACACACVSWLSHSHFRYLTIILGKIL